MLRRSRLWVCAVAILTLALAGAPAATAPRHRGEKAPPAPAPAPAPPPQPAQPPDTRPYDAQIMRLAEILGALTTMRRVCGAGDADQWRQHMQALLDSEGSPASRKDRLAGAYNRGLQSYAITYRTCTANARVVVERFLIESGRLAKDLENRYRPS